MRRWLIGLGVLVLVLAGLSAFALARLGRWIDDNRGWIAEQAGDALDRRVTFDEIGVSLWGGLGVRVRGLVVGDDPRFSDQPFVRAAQARVRIGLFSALLGRYTVREVVLEQPEITVVRTAEGFNFDSLGGTATKPPGGEAEPRAEDDQPAVHPAVIVALLDVRGGRLRWIDRTADPAVDLTFDRVDLEVSDVDLEAPIALELSAALPGSSAQNLHVEGTVGPLGSPPDVQAAPVALTLAATGVEVASLAAALPPDARLPPELVVEGPLDADAEVKGTLAAFEANGRVDAGAAAVRWAEMFAKPAGTVMTLEARGRRGADGDQLESATLRLADLELAVAGALQPGHPPQVDGRVTSNRAPLAPLASLLPALAGMTVGGQAQLDVGAKGAVGHGRVPALDGTVTLADVAASLPAAPVGLSGLSGTLTLSGTKAVLPPSPCRVGDAEATLGLAVDDVAARRGRLTLAAPAMDLAALGLAKGDVARQLDVEAVADAAGEQPVVTLTARSASGAVSGVAYRDLDTRLVRRDGIVTIERFGLGAYDGTLAVTGQLDPRDAAAPRFALKPVVHGMSLAALAGERLPLEGRLEMTADLAGRGTEWKTVQKTLAGTGTANVKNGRLRGVNLIDEALGKLTGIPGLTTLLPANVRKKHPALFTAEETRFDDLHARFRIADGTVHLPEMRLATTDYAVTGAGSATFAGAVRFDGRLIASPALTADIITGVKLARNLRAGSGKIEVPFKVTGTTNALRVVPDPEFIATALTRTLAEEGGDVIQKGLDALFGGGGKRRKGR